MKGVLLNGKMPKSPFCLAASSSEHEVSRISATSVLKNLDAESRIYPVGITKKREGRVVSVPGTGWSCWRTAAGSSIPPMCPAQYAPGSGLAGLVCFESAGVRSVPVDVVFPVLHGKNGEDGTVQGLRNGR